LSWQSAEIVGKRMELLRELVPGNGLIGLIWDEESKSSWLAAESDAKARGWRLLSLEIKRAEELEATFKRAVQSHVDGILVYAAGLLFARRAHVAKLAAESRLPAMYHLKPYVEDGGLIAYSADLVDGWHRGASYVDKLLRGAKRADLPIQQPTKIELVINIKAARDLGLNIPQSILIRADDVIQ
jgi:putative ABC transport system substrate-binding protein